MFEMFMKKPETMSQLEEWLFKNDFNYKTLEQHCDDGNIKKGLLVEVITDKRAQKKLAIMTAKFNREYRSNDRYVFLYE